MKPKSIRNRVRENLEEQSALIGLWCLRIALVPAALVQIRERLNHVEQFIAAIGYDLQDENRAPPAAQALAGDLRERRKKAESKNPVISGSLNQNLRFLSTRFKLAPIHGEILALAVLCRLDDALQEGLSFFQKLTDHRLSRLLGAVLGRPWEECEAALDAKSPLITCRLVTIRDDITSFDEKITLLPGLARALLSRNRGPEDLLRFALSKAAAPKLQMQDFDHLRAHLDILVPYLKAAAKERLKGVNVLIFGSPGVGKTELACLLAAHLGLHLYEVPFVDADGDPEHHRVWRYAFLQTLLARRPRTAVLFDEIEDAMPWRHSSLHGTQKGSGEHKAWTNRQLEGNPVPAIWIGNQVGHIDEAFLRRFSYVIELDTPPRSARKRMLRAELSHLDPSEDWLERQAEDKNLSPALVSKVAAVLTLAGARDRGGFELAFETALEGRMAAIGQSGKADRYPYPKKYRPELVNASIEPEAVAERLRRLACGSLLFQGPPGSGKTAYAHYLAKRLDRPLLLKRASDLHGPWFGETEQKLGKMFREAAQEKAVLLLDEADSFLYDRRGAQRSWEVAHVNELLTQMECFEGIFICATNFAANLDPAAMRRFGAKIKFDYLSPTQVRILFVDTLESLGISGQDDLLAKRLETELGCLNRLTPGDFTAATRSLRLGCGELSGMGLMQALKAECDAKEGGHRPIGFAA
jgi:AAA+ superfamily predicted ATPase